MANKPKENNSQLLGKISMELVKTEDVNENKIKNSNKYYLKVKMGDKEIGKSNER